MSRRPVIAIVGNDVPRQLVLASGATPSRITGSWRGEIDPAAAALLGAADAPTARILAELTAGSPRWDGLIVCTDSQANTRLFSVLRAIAPQMPLHLLDLPRAESSAARRFARVQLESLVAFLSGVTGVTPDARALTEAAREERDLGLAVARLRDRRRAVPPQCHGTLALAAMIAAAQLPPSEAIARLDAARSDVAASATRVHVTGSNHPDASLYRVLEEQAFVVVSEDHDTGDAAWLGSGAEGSDGGDILDGLLDQHFDRVGASSTASSAARAALTRDTVLRSGAELVVAVVRELDEAPAWDLADQSAELEEMKVPLVVRTRVSPGNEVEAARDLIRSAADRAVRA